MPEEPSLDLVALGFAMQGVARAMEAIPKEAWLESVRMATDTFKTLIRPITATTGGVGRWIDQKFDNKVEVEKILLAHGLLEAMKRIERSAGSVNPKPNLAVLAPIIEGVSVANKAETREMWINLLARELSMGEVHPEFVNILNRLSPSDARLLLKFAKDEEGLTKRARQRRAQERAQAARSREDVPEGRVPTITVTPLKRVMGKDFDLSETVLESLNLIETINGPCLTEIGEKFLEAVGELSGNSGESVK